MENLEVMTATLGCVALAVVFDLASMIVLYDVLEMLET